MMIQSSIPLSPIFLQMLLKLGESTLVTIFGLYCMKLVRDFHKKVSGGGGDRALPAPAPNITIALTSKQRKQIAGTSNDSPKLSIPGALLNKETEQAEVTIVLTKAQRRRLKEATGHDPARLKVLNVGSQYSNHGLLKAVFDKEVWTTSLHADPAMNALHFVDRWASTVLMVAYIVLKMYFNIKKWTS